MSVPALILAAGASTRLGAAKQLQELEGVPLLELAIRKALDAGLSPVHVVLGAQAVQIQHQLSERLSRPEVRTVIHPGWEQGMGSSLAAGIRQLEDGCAGVVVLLCDQPRLSTGLLQNLLNLIVAHPEDAVSCEDGGVRLPPAYLPAALFPELLALSGDCGAKSVLRNIEGLRTLPFPGGSQDVDTADDLTRHRRMESV